ncbi:MAG TPA: hypothetical protein VGD78_10485 [Chthoniobacterales bacterium]
MTGFPRSPEHLHLLLNHLPLTGLAIANLGLLMGLVFRSRAAQVCTLWLVLLCAGSAWPVYLTGKAGYRDIRRIADEPGMDYLDEHLDRADRFTLAYAPAAVLALAGLALPHFWPKSRTLLALLAFLGSTVALAAGTYIAEAGGKVRHLEIRPKPSDAPEVQPSD